MPILKTYNLSVADFTENKNVHYLYPDNWSHQKGSDIVKILRDSDLGIPLYVGLSPVKPFDETRGKFEVKFYLVAILFIIFDLEIIFLFPWAVAFKEIGIFGFWSMMFFLFVLTVGFIYEWLKGALDWN